MRTLYHPKSTWKGINMSASDKIALAAAIAQAVGVLLQIAIAIIAIMAIRASLSANKEQIDASERQLREQIRASETQVRQQIEENRRLATEERQQQSRPIVAPTDSISHNVMTYLDPNTGKASEDLYTSEKRINWSWQYPIKIEVRNMGNGPAFNLQCILYGQETTTQFQFVSWTNGPIEEKSSADIELEHPSDLFLFQHDMVNGKHVLYDTTSHSPTNSFFLRIARLTLTYHDLLGKKYVSIFHFTIEHKWIHVLTEEITSDPPRDLKELNDQKKLGPKLSAPPIQTS